MSKYFQVPTEQELLKLNGKSELYYCYKGFKKKLDKPLIGYKKALLFKDGTYTGRNCIVKLEIPVGATCVFFGGGNSEHKHRASVAKVLDILTIKELKRIEGNVFAMGSSGSGWIRRTTLYIKGHNAKPDLFDADIEEECTNGIHFFTDVKRAQKWDV